MTKRIFVSGSTGLLGSHILAELLRGEDEILALYRSDEQLLECKKVLAFYGFSNLDDKLTFIQGDISDVDLLQDRMEGCDEVYHCAALVSFDPKDAATLFKVNVKGTRNMVNAAIHAKVKKFLHVSSTAAIGSNENEILNEDSVWDTNEKHSYYAKSKFAAEREVWRAVEEGLEAVVINPCVIIGPGRKDKSSGTVFRQMEKGLKFYTEGRNSFVDARDVAEIATKLMRSDIRSERFLCIGENMSFRHFFDLLAKKMDKPSPNIQAKPWMTNIAWKLAWVFSLISGKPAAITSESSASAHSQKAFSSDKVKAYISHDFRNVENAIDNSMAYFSS